VSSHAHAHAHAHGAVARPHHGTNTPPPGTPPPRAAHSEDEEAVIAAAPEDAPGAADWVAALKHGAGGYDALSLPQRLAALLWLVGVVGEGLGVRGVLELREKEAAALKKQLLEDARVSRHADCVRHVCARRAHTCVH
jgi:hypothetical protein